MALATLEELTPRLAFVLDENEQREATGALEDLSFDAQAIGSPLWTDANVPQAVKNLVLRAAARHMKNYEGYTVSRAGDETVQWADPDVTGQATFTKDEKQMLKQMGGKMPFIGGVGIYAYGQKPKAREGMVPVAYAPTVERSMFPLFADDEGLW